MAARSLRKLVTQLPLNCTPVSCPAWDDVMKKFPILSLLWFGLSCLTFASEVSDEGESMTARGTFEVDLKPQADADFPAGRMVIDKTYLRDITGSGKG